MLNNLKTFFYLCGCTVLLAAPLFSAEEEKRSSATQQVGGLLFEVDEGVKVEQGPGGSVYVKSNREYMQEKFKEIETRLNALEAKMSKLEGASSGAPVQAPEEQAPARKVYVT